MRGKPRLVPAMPGWDTCCGLRHLLSQSLHSWPHTVDLSTHAAIGDNSLLGRFVRKDGELVGRFATTYVLVLSTLRMTSTKITQGARAEPWVQEIMKVLAEFQPY